MAFRLDPSLHQALSNSAVAHGIALAVSYRPFEHAGAKYYQLPAFDASGEFLWFFHPLASPAVNFHADEVGFAHYRELLPEAQPTTIHFDSVRNPAGFLARFRSHRDNLRILAAAFPPIQSDSFVLIRQPDGRFRLRPYREIQAAAEARRLVIRDFDLTSDPRTGIRITGLKIPSQLGFILLDNPSGVAPLGLPAHEPARLLSPDSTELGRNATYFAMPESSAETTATRIAGITPQGGFHSLFFAAEASLKLDGATAHHDLLSSVLVIARGEPYSSEMVDFNLPRARDNAVREMRAVLAYPAFREIFVNTRSHTQLVASQADGARGIQPIGAYRENNERYTHLGIDLAYAPRSTVLQREPLSVLTAFQPGEWTAPCLSPRALTRGVWPATGRSPPDFASCSRISAALSLPPACARSFLKPPAWPKRPVPPVTPPAGTTTSATSARAWPCSTHRQQPLNPSSWASGHKRLRPSFTGSSMRPCEPSRRRP